MLLLLQLQHLYCSFFLSLKNIYRAEKQEIYIISDCFDSALGSLASLALLLGHPKEGLYISAEQKKSLCLSVYLYVCL